MIVITGSESFVGRELIKQLLEQKKEIIGIDLLNEKSQNYEYIKMDICSNNITDFIPNNAETIIHLAALSTDPLCKGKAYKCFDINVMGTLNLMNAVMKKMLNNLFLLLQNGCTTVLLVMKKKMKNQ